MGIGANRRAPEGDEAGWRGGREFEHLLARLNQAQNADTPDIPIDDGDATDENSSAIGAESTQQPVKGDDDPSEPTVNGKNLEGKTGGKGDGERKKKRKRSGTEDEETDGKEAKRRRKEEKKRRKEERKAEEASKRLQTSQNSEDGPEEPVSTAVQGMGVPRYRAYVSVDLHDFIYLKDGSDIGRGILHLNGWLGAL
jgi:hypothetical protein